MGTKTPWHVWVVGILSLLWDGSGAYTILLAQRGAWPGMQPDELAYYASQQLWFVVLVNLGLATALLGGLALLLRKRWAVWSFRISLAAILFGDAYDLAMGTSRVYANHLAAAVTLIIAVLAALQLYYATVMAKRGVLT